MSAELRGKQIETTCLRHDGILGQVIFVGPPGYQILNGVTKEFKPGSQLPSGGNLGTMLYKQKWHQVRWKGGIVCMGNCVKTKQILSAHSGLEVRKALQEHYGGERAAL